MGAMQNCLVTGAAGYLGRNLTRALLDRGVGVRALVHRTPLELQHERLQCVRGDVTDPDRMEQVCEGVDTVFHAAAMIALLGGRSATEAYRKPVWRANVEGTENLLNGSRRQGVVRFVYTSSVDVCFDGTPLPDMDESTPYARRTRSVYQETKIEAEKRVLAANGKGGLYTCAIRADGIYGPGENLLLDSLVEMIAAGALKFAMGSADSLQDNSYIENLIHGELLAAENLGPEGRASGRAYFIGDYEPQNTFEFARPLFEALDFPFPKRRIPAGPLRAALIAWEHLHFRLGLPAPFLSPHELDKISVTHYGSIRDAERDLGYAPVKRYREAMEACIPYCREVAARIQTR